MKLFQEGGMKRDEWVVQYPAAQLASAAESKKIHHQGRLDWWKRTKSDVIEDIKSDGITVTESIVDEIAKAGYANTVPAMHGGPVVQIDAALQAHLREAQQKIEMHQQLVAEFDSWGQMMAAAPPEAMFDLTQSDWLFFFGT